MVKGLIFDLGSTLMYFETDWQEIDSQATKSLVSFLRENGIMVGEDFPSIFAAERARGWQISEETQIEHTIEEALSASLARVGFKSVDGLVPQAVERFLSKGEIHWQAYPEALQALQSLKDRGLLLGLISNADDDGLVQRSVVRFGFAPYLQPVISSAGFKWRKPNPRIFQHVAAEWRLSPQDIAMVGDAPKYDILGAHLAGMRGILINRNENQPYQLIPPESANDPAFRPDATVSTLTELATVVEHL